MYTCENNEQCKYKCCYMCKDKCPDDGRKKCVDARMCEEFGNLPTVECIANIITIN